MPGTAQIGWQKWRETKMGYMTIPLEMLESLDVSPRAREAVARFRPPWGGDVREILEDDWRDSVSPYFDELLAAVADRTHPVPQGYFDSGLSLPCNPLFMILDPKFVHALCDALSRETGAFDAVGASVFLPYVAKWDTLLRLLAERFGRRTEIEAVGAKLRLVVDALRRAADLSCGRAEQGLSVYYDRYSDLRNAFSELGMAIAECGSGGLAAPHPSTLSPESEMRRPRYPRDDGAMEILLECHRRKGREKYRRVRATGATIVREMLREGKESDASEEQKKRRARMLQGGKVRRDGEEVREREGRESLDEEAAVRQWSKYLSEFSRSRKPRP